MSNIIAVTGATGKLGRLVIGELVKLNQQDNVIALARDTQKAEDLGVAVRYADYTDKDSFIKALAGVDTLLLISARDLGKRVEQHQTVIEAAQQAGVKRIVYTGALGATKTDLPLVAEHLHSEDTLKQSGLDYTILRNGWYAENYAGHIKGALEKGVVVGSAGDALINLTARQDLAEAAAIVLTEEGHSGKTYELASDSAYTLADFAQTVAKLSGKDVQYQDLSEADYEALLVSAGLPPMLAKMTAQCDTMMKSGAFYSQNGDLSRILGRATTPLAEVLKAYVSI